MISSGELHHLRNTLASDLVENYASYCKGQFCFDGVPVVIATRNEELDLPATLIALASSESPVLPIVAEGGSYDRTADYAKDMGAVVLSDLPQGKMLALQVGTSFAEETSPGKPVLYIDGDTLVGRQWAATMSEPLLRSNNHPVVACGMGIVRHGQRRRVDAFRTTYIFTREASRAVTSKPPIARGWNMGIAFDSEGQMLKAFQELDPNLFLHQENAVRDIAIQLGGCAIRVSSPKAWVVTRGDRYASLAQCVRVFFNDSARKSQYFEDYGANIEQYPNEYEAF